MVKKEGKMRVLRWAAVVFIALVILGSAGYYLTKDLVNIRIKDFTLTYIRNVQLNSFEVSGELLIDNPGKITVPVRAITYTTTLKESGELLGSGTIPGFRLERATITSVPFNHRVTYGPISRLAQSLLTNNEVIISVNGVIILDLPGQPTLPFQDEIDVREFI